MADNVTAGKPKDFDGENNKFPPHPAGPVMMVIADVVDLGEAVIQYQNNPPYLAPKCAIVLASGQRNPSGDLWEVAQEFTVSTGHKSKLRPFLEAIRGAKYTEDYPDVPLHKLVGYPVYCVIAHTKSEKTGYTYANITSIAPLPPGTPKPVVEGYKRLERWEKKRAQYKQDADAFRAANAPKQSSNDFAATPAASSDDGLPF